MKKLVGLLLVTCVAAISHETLTTTVLFDREIVRILDRHCVMCHAEDGPSFPLETYEQTWLQKRPIRVSVIARHMPPWAAVSGYGQFANENSLTLRETQFVISWVEGLGPRNAGTVFTNTASGDAKRPQEIHAHTDFGKWQLGEPQLKRRLSANTVEPQANETKRVIIDLGLTSERRLRALEFMPGDRRVVRAAFFAVQETGQWIGSWTPWYGFMSLPKGTAYRLPAGSHIVAEIHYRGVKERVADQGTLGLFFADPSATDWISDVVLESKTRLTADTYVVALKPEIQPGIKFIEVSARKLDGSTEILLFAKDIPVDWPTPYILKDPVLIPRGTVLSVNGAPRLTVSTYRARK
jgi:hypothetical protein